MKYLLFILCLGVAVAAVPIEDQVILKYDDGGPRYQYMTGPDGPELVDLWLKTSDLEKSTRYNPATDNGYHLFTRKNPTVSQPIPLGADAILSSSNYNPNRKTVVLIHGWRNIPTSDFNAYLITAYLIAEDVNVIMVDWSVGAAGLYLVAMNNLIRSAEHVATYVNWLNSSSGGNISRYHFIGHSLGAHQAGIVGRHLQSKIPYITGLDPALPGWINNTLSIKSDDALYTEIMHTNVGVSGLVSPRGHVDFYPNGGRGMPGCDDDNNCDHHKCIFYMAESLILGGFTGRQCENLQSALIGNCTMSNTLMMGGTKAKTGNSGLYHLTTNAESPFSKD